MLDLDSFTQKGILIQEYAVQLAALLNLIKYNYTKLMDGLMEQAAQTQTNYIDQDLQDIKVKQ